jgi:hypothetical protein
MIKILIAEDPSMVLAALLEMEDDFEVIEQASNYHWNYKE